ncbi:hypothetical protein BDV93DRAFT_563671 [Ceratobasidium sp. AG-I]|nr:hypothetical protein BDV93DRAFT_563671 [Ceratobasidium sp. AG-I]
MVIPSNSPIRLVSMSALVPAGNAGPLNPPEVTIAPAPQLNPGPGALEQSPALKSLWGIPLGHQHGTHE